MSTSEDYEKYIENYFKDRPALLHFGALFIKHVYDPSIKRFIDAYDGRGGKQISCDTFNF